MSKEATLARLLWMDDLVAAVGRGEMPTSAIGAGYVISRKVNSKSGVAWAKQKIMAKMIGIKEDSFQRLVRVLHDHGFLGITVKWADGKKHNHYVLTRPAADERYLNPGIPATDPDLNPGRYPDLNPDNLSKVDLSNQSSSSVGANPAAAIDDDGLLSKLTEAAGGHIAAGCANVRPIRALMATGVDLDLDVLPFIRENVTKLREPLKTWNAHWLKPGLLDFARSRKASPKPLGNALPPHHSRRFVARCSAEWRDCAQVYRDLHGGRDPPTRQRTEDLVEGWDFEHSITDRLVNAEAAE